MFPRSLPIVHLNAIFVALRGRWLDGLVEKSPQQMPPSITEGSAIVKYTKTHGLGPRRSMCQFERELTWKRRSTADLADSDRFWQGLVGSSRVFTVGRGGPKEIGIHPSRVFPMNVVILSFYPGYRVRSTTSISWRGGLWLSGLYLIPMQSRCRGSGQSS